MWPWPGLLLCMIETYLSHVLKIKSKTSKNHMTLEVYWWDYLKLFVLNINANNILVCLICLRLD